MGRAFVLALLAAALLLAGAEHHSHHHHDQHHGAEDEPIALSTELLSGAFKSGRDYRFRYDVQTATGYPSWISTQRAINRLQATVRLAFQSANRVVLQMEDVRVGQLNVQPRNEEWNPARIQPISAFQPSDSSVAKKLDLACEFAYSDGIVKNIRFDAEDQPWSKNIKKAVLNLIQLNLQPENVARAEVPSEKQSDALQSQKGARSLPRAFTVAETTIEGECDTLYTLSKANTQLNVTKSINFEQCRELADVGYGFQVDLASSLTKKLRQQDVLPMQHGPQQQQHQQQQQSEVVIPKEKIDRSTVIRVVMDEGKTGEERYGIQRVELVSEYVLKSFEGESSQAMQMVAAAELVFISSTSSSSKVRAPQNAAEAETLIYNADFERQEKRFFMLGDEDKQRGGNPFTIYYPDAKAKLEQADLLLQKLTNDFEEKQEKEHVGGIEGPAAGDHFNDLVELLRTCSVPDLHELQKRSMGVSKASDLFVDALAVAATRNTLYVLVERLERGKDISEVKTAQILKTLGRGAGLPAPSDKQVDLILRLCKAETILRSEKVLKPACWLTFGSMVGELRQQTWKVAQMGRTESPMKTDEICEKHKITLYKEVLLQNLDKAQNQFERIVAIKAIGNAGLETTLPVLREIIQGTQESHIVRFHAIDALRRLRRQSNLVKQIHSMLLPIFVNTNEHPAVRMACVHMILRTKPSHPVIDQIASSMTNEKSDDVLNFVYTTMKMESESPIKEQQRTAEHLRSAMKLIKINTERSEQSLLTTSQNSEIPMFNHQLQDGLFVKLLSMFGRNGNLPMHIAVGVDSYVNDQETKDGMQVSLCQKDLDRVLRHLVGLEHNSQSVSGEEQSEKRSFFANAAQQIKSIFQKLNIKGRSSRQYAEQEKDHPYGVLSFRFNDVDVAVCPLVGLDQQEEGMAAIKAKFMQTIRQLTQAERSFQLNSAIVLKSRAGRIPTSTGMQLKFAQSAILIGSIEAKLNAKDNNQIKMKIQPNVDLVQSQRMQVTLTPQHISGVRSQRALEFNVPLKVELKTGNSEKEMQVSVLLPKKETRVFGAHSLATTFLMKGVKEEGQRMRTIHNEQLESQQRDVHTTVAGLPLRIHGHFHVPRDLSNHKEIAKVLMAAENQLHVVYEPIESETPEEIKFTFKGDFFKANTQQQKDAPFRQNLQQFLSNFQAPIFSRSSLESSSPDNEDDDIDSGDYATQSPAQQKRVDLCPLRRPCPTSPSDQVNRLLEKYSNERSYKHNVRVTIETVGGRRPYRAEARIEGVCNAKLNSCEAKIKARRPAMLAGERGEWVMDAQMQTIYPDHVNHIDELLDGDYTKEQQQKFFGKVKAEWGSDGEERKQFVEVYVQGQPSAQMLKAFSTRAEYERNQDSETSTSLWYAKKNQGTSRGPIVPFLNQYTVVADYKLSRDAQKTFQSALELMKAKNYWNTRSQLFPQTTKSLSLKDTDEEQIRISVTIDPITCRHANISLQAPGQTVRFQSLELPSKMRPVRLVRPFGAARAHSMRDLLVTMSKGESGGYYGSRRGGNKAECRVDAEKIETFDGVMYKTPLSTCYSVLAKDCGNNEQPSFVVLVKNTKRNGEQKKLKVITPREIIEIEPTTAGVEDEQPQKLIVKINNKRYTSEQLREAAIRSVEIDTDAKGREWAVVDVENTVVVKFNGKSARVQLVEEYKNTQCGLCGNYNDDSDDEFRMNNDELASDLKSFHSSYLVKDEQDCDEAEPKRFYELEHFKKGAEQGEATTQPIQKTMVLEYNKKLCFSLKLVKQCPEGWYAGESEQEEELLKRQKVPFSCLDRGTIEARRLKEQVRRSGVAEMGEYTPSFIENVVVPEQCIQY